MEIKRIAVLGCGVIGASWATYFLAKGFKVNAYDLAPDAESLLKSYVTDFWPVLEAQGLAAGASIENLSYFSDLAEAVKDVDFIQENAPERIEIKKDLLKVVEDSTSPKTIISSSSSGLLVSDIQAHAKHPERIVLGHPFNPPHLIPLVEVIGGKLTSKETIDQTMDFYNVIGKKPIHIKSEVKGHVANRLQAALWREAFSLVGKGVVSVQDLDTAIAYGPGLRWALLGPFLNLHLSGGAGGISHVLEHLGPPIENWWADLDDTKITPEILSAIINGVADELAGWSDLELAKTRDDLLLKLLKSKNDAGL